MPLNLMRTIFGGSDLKALRGGAVFSLAIKVLAMLLSFFVIVLMNRLTSVTEFGAYMYALSLISLLRIVTVFGGERWLVREVAASRSDGGQGDTKHLLKGVLVVAMVLSLIIAFALYAVTEIAPWLLNGDALDVVKLSLLLLPLVTLVTIYQAYIRGLSRAVVAQIPEAIIRPTLVIAGLSIVGFFTVISISAVEIMSLQIIASLFALVILVLLAYSHSKPLTPTFPTTEKFSYRDFLRAGLALVMIAVVIRGSSFVVSILLGNMASVTDVAMFTVSKRLSDLVTFMQAAIVMPLAPMIAQKFKQGKKQELKRLAVVASWGSFLFALPISAILLFFPEWILSVFGSQYKDAEHVLHIMVITQLITVSLGPVTIWLTMTNNEVAAIKAAVVGFIFLVALSVVLIPGSGATGGALSFSTGLIVTQLLMLWFVMKKVQVDSSILGLRYLVISSK